MDSLTDYYKYAQKKNNDGITAPLAGSIVGSNIGIGVREILAKKKSVKGVKGAALLGLTGMTGALSGLYVGSKFGKSREKKALFVPGKPTEIKGATSMIKDPGKTTSTIKPQVPKV